jgi:hypothetical protein
MASTDPQIRKQGTGLKKKCGTSTIPHKLQVKKEVKVVKMEERLRLHTMLHCHLSTIQRNRRANYNWLWYQGKM